MRGVMCCLAAVLLGGGIAVADITVVVATDGSDRLVIARASDYFTQRSDMGLVNHNGQLVRYHGMADCKIFGSSKIAAARATPTTGDVLLAQYNAVNLWLGRVCYGKSDALPEPGEARAWLNEIEGVRIDGKPLLDAHDMMAEFLLFGAPGFEPDHAAALNYLLKEVEMRPARAGLFLAYIYENGLGVPRDAAKALEWVETSAAAGDFEAQTLRAQALELGLGRPRDEAAAVQAYADIEANAPVARFREGLMYLDGRGTAKDACKAKELLTWAFKAMDPSPQAKPYLDRIEAEKLCP